MWIGAIGFAVMVGGRRLRAHPAAAQGRPRAPSSPTAPCVVPRPSRPKSKAQDGGSFMNRIEERWDRRRDDGY